MATEENKTVKTALRDEKGRFTKKDNVGDAAVKAGAIAAAANVKERKRSPVNGQPVPEGTPFRTSDERAREAGRRSGAARREKGDLRRLCQAWMETEVATGNDGEKITGGQMMVRVAVKEVARGNPKFWELLRDTAGFKPVDRVMIADVDPAVIDEVEAMVQDAGEDDD